MAKEKKHKLTSMEIEKLIGMGMRYGAFTMWAITEQPKMIADKCMSILDEGARNLSREQVEMLHNSIDKGSPNAQSMVNTLIEQLGTASKERFKDEVGGAFWHSQNCWNVEKAFIGLHEEHNVYETCSAFMRDHIKFVASKVEEHGSMDKFIETLLPPSSSESDAPSP
jgi:hypothetical protein